MKQITNFILSPTVSEHAVYKYLCVFLHDQKNLDNVNAAQQKKYVPIRIDYVERESDGNLGSRLRHQRSLIKSSIFGTTHEPPHKIRNFKDGDALMQRHKRDTILFFLRLARCMNILISSDLFALLAKSNREEL